MTLAKLFGEKQLQIPLAIITDADPATVKENDALEESWKNSLPAQDASGNFIPSDRLTSLITAVKDNPFVSVFSSFVTLEYDLALAGQRNGDVMLEAWKTGFDREPRTFSAAGLKACGADLHKRAICAWRGICLSNATRSKAFLAQELASKLSAKTETGAWIIPPNDFVIPPYIKNAIKHVC